MSKKYIIEIEDEPFVRQSCLHGEQGLYKCTAFNSLVFDKNGINKLTPLTVDTAIAYLNETGWSQRRTELVEKNLSLIHI